jgi:hypothetical protein
MAIGEESSDWRKGVFPRIHGFGTQMLFNFSIRQNGVIRA